MVCKQIIPEIKQKFAAGNDTRLVFIGVFERAESQFSLFELRLTILELPIDNSVNKDFG